MPQSKAILKKIPLQTRIRPPPPPLHRSILRQDHRPRTKWYPMRQHKKVGGQKTCHLLVVEPGSPAYSIFVLVVLFFLLFSTFLRLRRLSGGRLNFLNFGCSLRKEIRRTGEVLNTIDCGRGRNIRLQSKMTIMIFKFVPLELFSFRWVRYRPTGPLRGCSVLLTGAWGVCLRQRILAQKWY